MKEHQRKKWIGPAVEVIAGLVTGYVVWRVTDADKPEVGLLTIAIGLLTTLVVASVNRHIAEESRAEKLDERFDLLLSRLGDRLADAAELSSYVAHGEIRVRRDRTSKVWLDLLWRCSTRFWGTIYTAPGELIETSLFDLGHSILATKVRVEQVDARRVFIVDDLEEVNASRAAFERQTSSGIQVRWIERRTIESHPFLRDQIQDWSSLDISLLDSRLIWSLQLDGSRRIASGTLQVDPEKARRYEETYRQLWDAAQV